MIEAQAPVNTTSEAAQLGTDVHCELAIVVEMLSTHCEHVAIEVYLQAIEPEETQMLVAAGHRMLQKIHAAGEFHKQNWMTEYAMESELFTGTADIDDSTDNLVMDFKTGRKQADYSKQLAGYASLHRAKHTLPPGEKITTIVLWLRTEEIEVLSYDNAALDKFEAEYKAKIALAGSVYSPGESCTFCPRQHECAAKNLWRLSSVQSLSTVSKDTAITREVVADLYPKSRMLRAALEHYESVLRAELEHGPLKTNDGQTLELKEEIRQEIDAQTGWGVMSEHLTQDELARCIKVGKTALLDAIGKKAPSGSKSQSQRQVMAELHQAGAVKTTTRKVMVTK